MMMVLGRCVALQGWESPGYWLSGRRGRKDDSVSSMEQKGRGREQCLSFLVLLKPEPKRLGFQDPGRLVRGLSRWLLVCWIWLTGGAGAMALPYRMANVGDGRLYWGGGEWGMFVSHVQNRWVESSPVAVETIIHNPPFIHLSGFLLKNIVRVPCCQLDRSSCS